MLESEAGSILPRLQACNAFLLKIYYSLYHEIDGEETENQRDLLCSRIAMREKFKLEIMQILEEDDPVQFGAVDSMYEWVAHKEFLLKTVFIKHDWSSCNELERENIKIYYELLYSRRFSDSFTNLLLKQKKEVEETLSQELPI